MALLVINQSLLLLAVLCCPSSIIIIPLNNLPRLLGLLHIALQALPIKLVVCVRGLHLGVSDGGVDAFVLPNPRTQPLPNTLIPIPLPPVLIRGHYLVTVQRLHLHLHLSIADTHFTHF